MYHQSPSSGTNSAKRIGRDVPTDEQPAPKRRRRIFSCESCQRLKCKCDFDANSQACRRCHNLRIPCSRRDDVEAAGPRAESPRALMSLENRLQETESTLQELTSLVKSLSDRVAGAKRTREKDQDGSNSVDMLTSRLSDTDGPERIWDPADHAVPSAPIVVLREIGRRCTGVHTRPRRLKNVDLLELGILNHSESEKLITSFFHYKKHNLLIGELGQASSSDMLRQASPFLHSICCLQAVVYQVDGIAASTHERIYDQVRISLGQMLLVSPLTLEEIQGVLLMSDNGPLRTNEHPDYIDSWMLTGYCAQQAMLSISFSEIVEKIKKGTSTISDQRAIRLWSSISLHHLHWAASTGRPSTIPADYLENCNILLSFYDASMHDGMLLAEVLLYVSLLEKLEGRHAPDYSRGNLEFAAWKQRWNHLLVLPTASMLKVGYLSACLILAVRSLQELDEDLTSNTFLSDPPSCGSREGMWPSGAQQSEREEARATLRASACGYAQSILQTFLQIPTYIKNSVGSNRCLCLEYSALVLAHYDEPESKLSDRNCLDLITRLHQWLRSDPSKSWATRLGKLAKQKMMARLESNQGRPGVILLGDKTNEPARRPISLLDSQQEYAGPSLAGEDVQTRASRPSPGAALEPNTTMSDIDFGWGETFPNIEDFFSGGFLDFGFIDRV